MKRVRRLLVAAIVIIAAAVGVSYQYQRGLLARAAPALPKTLPTGIQATADDWHYAHTKGDGALYEVRAKEYRQIKEPSLWELEQVELKLFHKGGATFDRITSAKAQFDTAEGVLFSEGEVEITMGLRPQQQPREKLLRIKSSGVRFETKTSLATTDKPATFQFDRGDGRSTGARYDSNSQELYLAKDVELHWRSPNRQDKNMVVQAGELTYKEKESKVYLGPWSRLLRGSLTLNATTSVVFLDKGDIRLVEAQQALGSDKQEKRLLEYGASQLNMHFSPEGEVETIDGTGNARLTSTAAASRTDVTAERVDLTFQATADNSLLQRALANGKTVIEAKPIPRPGVALADTRILRSDVVEMLMKPNGEWIDKVATHTPGRMELEPNRPGQPRRHMDADRITMTYADENRIRDLRATQVQTRTEYPGAAKKRDPALTWSKDLNASFHPQTGELAQLEQWDQFRYEEGSRKAKSDHATLNAPDEKITLRGVARVSDPTGATDADTIWINQKNSDFDAEGHVVSSRLPDPQKPAAPGATSGKSGSLLGGEELTQARAKVMHTRDDNQQIQYEGDAMLWQGANRITAQRIDIDRRTDVLVATTGVVSQFVERKTPVAPAAQGSAVAAKPAPPAPAETIFTVVKSQTMHYNDRTRIAHYRGEVFLTRPGLQVQSQELQAFLTQTTEGESSLEKAYADGQVKIQQTTPERTRTGFGEHSEYYVQDERILLQGGEPQLIDSVRGTTRGKQLTYFANNDRLVVDGTDAKAPAVSRIKRKIRITPAKPVVGGRK